MSSLICSERGYSCLFRSASMVREQEVGKRVIQNKFDCIQAADCKRRTALTDAPHGESKKQVLHVFEEEESMKFFTAHQRACSTSCFRNTERRVGKSLRGATCALITTLA